MARPRVRFNWEEAVAQDRDLQRIEAFTKLTLSKFPGLPAPRADAGRGSRYQPPPPVKTERMYPCHKTSLAIVTSTNYNTRTETSTMGATTTPANGDRASSSGGSTPQFIDVRDYATESSSEVDAREVNPMDELSDFEAEQSLEQEQEMEQEQAQEQEMDVEMDAGDLQDEEEQQTACQVCKRSHRESEIMLCDDCSAEFHIFCLDPPLPQVPDETWFCPECSVKHPAAAAAVDVKEEEARTAGVSAGTGDSAAAAPTSASTASAATATAGPSGSSPASGVAPSNGTGGNDPASISVSGGEAVVGWVALYSDDSALICAAVQIAQALESDAEKSDLLLIHACSCDDIKCTDPEFHVFCPHMKRFLRSVCWASHSDKWRSYRLARITAELFAYHAMKCTISECNVPLCVKIREEEIV
ncbi:PHD and RING finger domain-containing protein 1 [Phytophthora pseudosyringae]|uniref:PHD and RING finger domain-containing protein 1 n=1 Tax=Phytophthora pseudosyringae TaxID=221518 RepID=A0A8T1WGM3_9STRA|nr:PHD and RING finger domain-containing protein 1 [Phytophthora pseudosyringae]